MSKGQARAGFDIDLREGVLREVAFVKAMREVGYLVEHKSDHRAKQTGKVFIEYQQKGRPSGIATTEAHFWAIEFDDTSWVVLPTDRLKWLCKQHWQTGRVKGGDNNQYDGVLIPVSHLVRLDYLATGTADAVPQKQLDRAFSEAAKLPMDEDDADLDAAWERAIKRLEAA